MVDFDVTEHNARIFDTMSEWYSAQDLYPVETVLFERHRSLFAGKRVLDLGVGSGRTTRPLLPLVADYLGVDRSEAMLAAARKSFPTAAFLDMDVRAIADLGAERFDFVLGALAILSAFGHEERLGVIDAVCHVLAPGGVFAFSFHNRRWKRAGRMPLHAHSWRPHEFVNSVHPKSWMNYLRLKRFAREEAEYALHVDPAHRWSGLFYFTDMETQTRQLARAGFTVIDRLGEDGRIIQSGEVTANDGLITLVAQKCGSTSQAI